MAINVTLGPSIPNTTIASFSNVPGTVIQVGTNVPSNQSWCTSPNEEFVFIMQSDGNLVQYRVIGNPPPFAPGVVFSGEAMWSSGTTQPGDYLVVQSDGNLVIYNSDNQPIWSSGTGGAPAGLYVQDDSNIVLYVLGPRWASIGGIVS